MQSLRFPWSLTEISKLPHARIDVIAKEFLNPHDGQTLATANAFGIRQNTLKTYRLVIRLLTEMQLCSVVALSRLVGQDHMGGNAFVALLAETGRAFPQSLLHGSAQGGFAQGGRPIAIRAMARSFHRPYETMRRALHRLVDLGLAELREEGAALNSTIIERPDVQAYLAEMNDIAITLMEDLFVFAKLSRPEFSDRQGPQRSIKLAALDLHLLSVEGMQGLFTDWTGLLLAAAITAGNIRDVTYHPELAFAYAAPDKIPPMDLRKPVYFKALCDILPISPTTAWRRIAVMKMLGSVKDVDGGLIFDGKWLANATMIANACDRIERMHSIINSIRLDNVEKSGLDQLYINGKVEPICL